MRFLLDTNILIPLEDSQLTLEENLSNFVRLAHENGHQLVYHPSTEEDIRRDSNVQRRQQTLERLRQYTRLEHTVPCPWNTPGTSPNDRVDNEILFALQCDAVHALITEDQGIHRKAKNIGLSQNVYTIQTSEDWLRRLYERTCIRLPNIEDIFLYNLTPYLDCEFFNSLRERYVTFNDWFRSKARNNNKAWVVFKEPGTIGAICIYDQQQNEVITQEGLRLQGQSLKLCTFKVSQGIRGRKIGELFLKATFRYATANRIENIFIHGKEDEQHFLFNMLEDFGFRRVGSHPGANRQDSVYLKEHPVSPPCEELEPFEYAKKYFPHFRHDEIIKKFIVPIRPFFHGILFPDYVPPGSHQLPLFTAPNDVGNSIKLAYLCHAQTRQIAPGDAVLFYISRQGQAITTIGIVESYETLEEADSIARKVKRRTVYSMSEIIDMAERPTRVMLFRLIGHLNNPLSREWLVDRGVLRSAPQSITKISNRAFEEVLSSGW